MKKLIMLFALIMIIVHSTRFIIRLNRVLGKAMSLDKPEEAVTSQEESR